MNKEEHRRAIEIAQRQTAAAVEALERIANALEKLAQVATKDQQDRLAAIELHDRLADADARRRDPFAF